MKLLLHKIQAIYYLVGPARYIESLVESMALCVDKSNTQQHYRLLRWDNDRALDRANQPTAKGFLLSQLERNFRRN